MININFPTINNLNPFSKKHRLRTLNENIVQQSASPTPNTPFVERRRNPDRRQQENGEWPVDSRYGRDRRKTSDSEKEITSVDITA